MNNAIALPAAAAMSTTAPPRAVAN